MRAVNNRQRTTSESSWITHLRGHFLSFPPTPGLTHSAGAGARLLLAAASLEALRLAAIQLLYPGVPLLPLLAALLGLALLVIPAVANVKLTQLGLRPWRNWSTAEKSYFFQVLAIANVVFPLVFSARLQERIALTGFTWMLWNVFVPYLLFGFYQELVYRGMVQRELVRRWGVLTGILVANVLYAFGPLHWYYFESRASFAVPMFASIFLIGLFFGVLYHRSRNLWIVGVFHAIGNAYILSAVGPVR